LAAPEDTDDPYLAAAVYEAFGDLDEARRLLTRARSLGDERVQVTALLVKVLLAQSKFAAAANLTREIVERIAPDEARRVVTEARHGGAGIEAARLSLELAKTQRTLTDAVDAIFGFALAGLISEAKSAFSMALEYDAEAARKLLSDERLRGVRTDLEALCVP
jgi:tetratricopeptide (TPR) repeat protein